MVLFDIFRGSKESQRSAGRTRALLAAGLVGTMLLLPGCGDGGSKQQGAGAQNQTEQRSSEGKSEDEGPSHLEQAAKAEAQIPEVNVMPAGTADIHFTHEWPASTSSAQTVDVRARIEGTLKQFNFQEGFEVREGQVLFTIDDAPYRAQVQAAKASVSKAEADLQFANTQVEVHAAEAKVASAKVDLERAQRDVDRYKPLAASGTIATQILDNAVAVRDVALATLQAAQAELSNTKLSQRANIEIARAQLEAAKANLTQAELNVGYCTVTSPVSGVIGKINVYPGNLVGQPGNTQPLVSISTLDPIYANFSLSESEYLYIMNHHESDSGMNFELILGNGTVYPHKGKFAMIDRTMDPTTGTIGVRISFPNPDGLLREGQYGKLRVTSKSTDKCVVIPQRAVMTIQTDKSVYVLDENNTVQSRTITLGDVEDDKYVVQNGLKAGEIVIVDGYQKVKPGVPCKPITVSK